MRNFVKNSKCTMEAEKNRKNFVVNKITTFIMLGFVAMLACQCGSVEKPVDIKDYTPSKEFEPAWKKMQQNTNSSANTSINVNTNGYDIEETVRAMNALEVAQCQSEDFLSYLEYVAKQDFSRVAPDVLEQKKKLFPILQLLFDLQKQYEEFDDVWMLMRSATSGASAFASEINPVGVLGAMMTGGGSLSSNVGSGLDKAQTAAFDEYEKQKDLKRKLEREIEEIRLSYIEYLEDYAPVYYKYMQEWDALCLKKDKAYIDLYGGRPLEAYNQTQNILKEYPTNREALLLNGMSLILMANQPQSGQQYETSLPETLSSNVEDHKIINPEKRNELLSEAEKTLDNYVDLYPSRSAPALVLKGLLYRELGDVAKAVSCFDQASIEYPRQAAALTDLLDSYKARTYLNKTVEGKYLLRLYRSTMEGFGIFSPNLLKAHYYAEHGDTEHCKNEIFNHFFRRGNQDVYDCLLSDMQYCEDNLYSSFRQILLEQSFIDITVEPTTDWKFSDNDDEIKVTINNRSDIDLENVRIFLCLHYTDMYKDEYDVQKLPSINIIKHNDKTEIGVLELNYEDKKYNDITRIRAIAMTDDKICWIDNVDYKYMKASENAARNSSSSNKSNTANLSVKQQLLKDFDIDSEKLVSLIENGINVHGTTGGGSLWSGVKNFVSGKDNDLRIELPRMLAIIDPVFSLYQLNDNEKTVRPSENYLSGSNIHLKFDYEPKQNDMIPLYIYSDFANFKVTINFENGKPVVKNVEQM